MAAALWSISGGAGDWVPLDSPSEDSFQVQRPALEYPDSFPPATVRKLMISTLQVGNVQIVLDKTELETVRKRLGGTILTRGDAHDAKASLCYCGIDTDGPWALWLESSEIAGLTAIDGFALQWIAGKAKEGWNCRMLRGSESSVQLPIPIQLGQTETRVREILGRPTLKYRSTLIYYHSHEEAVLGGPCSVLKTVDIGLRNGLVWDIEVYKGTQC